MFYKLCFNETSYVCVYVADTWILFLETSGEGRHATLLLSVDSTEWWDESESNMLDIWNSDTGLTAIADVAIEHSAESMHLIREV